MFCRRQQFTIWDIGGGGKIKGLWTHYYQHMSAVIYVVDSNDRERIEAGDLTGYRL